ESASSLACSSDPTRNLSLVAKRREPEGGKIPLTVRFLFAYSFDRPNSRFGGSNVCRTIAVTRIRSGNGQYPQGSRTRSQREMELEAPRKVRNTRLASRARWHDSRLVHHDPANGIA